MNLTYLCVVINSYNSCMIHGDCRGLTILGLRSVTNTLLSLFHNALDHNDSSALPGHFMRTIQPMNYFYALFGQTDETNIKDAEGLSLHCSHN